MALSSLSLALTKISKTLLVRSWIAFDPGASGAMCILFDDSSVTFVDFKPLGIPGYVDLCRATSPEAIAIEQVYSRTGQGVKSVFSFGQRFGELEGMLQTLSLPYVTILPQRWQKFCGVVPKSGKPGVYTAISSLYPEAPLVGPRGGLIDGRCDALGIAHYLRFNTPS